jgi:hypothetical protein
MRTTRVVQQSDSKNAPGVLLESTSGAGKVVTGKSKLLPTVETCRERIFSREIVAHSVDS